jgi:hypothetical protein
MFNKVSSIVLALLLFAVLSSSGNHIWMLSIFLAALIAATLLINLRKLGLNWSHLLLPVLYLLGIGSIYMVITGPTIRLVFLVAASVSFFLLQKNLGKESHFLQNIYLFSVFALFVGIFALDFYLHLSVFWVVFLVFLISYPLIVQGFAGFSLPAKRYFYLLIALAMAQSAWGLSLWPTHFIVNAVVLFCFYYLLWTFSYSAFFGKLSAKKIYLQTGLVMLVLAITLGTAAWKPLL